MGLLLGIIFCSFMVICGLIALISSGQPEIFLIWIPFVLLDIYLIIKYTKRKLRNGEKVVADNTKSCSICSNTKISKRLVDGMVCQDCLNKSRMLSLNWKTESITKVKACIKETEDYEKLKQIFIPEKTIKKMLCIDYTHKMWSVPNINTIFLFDDIVNYEIIEDGTSVMSGGLGRAIVGGMAFGGAGAIVGGVTGAKITKQNINELGVKIVTRNPRYPSMYINILKHNKVKQGSILYNEAQGILRQIMTELTLMQDTLKREPHSVGSDVGELIQYKELLDKGILTQEEFDTKKKQILKL